MLAEKDVVNLVEVKLPERNRYRILFDHEYSDQECNTALEVADCVLEFAMAFHSQTPHGPERLFTLVDRNSGETLFSVTTCGASDCDGFFITFENESFVDRHCDSPFELAEGVMEFTRGIFKHFERPRRSFLPPPSQEGPRYGVSARKKTYG